MGLEDCLEFEWPRAEVFLDSTTTGKRELRRPYGRVDRRKLKRRLLDRCIDNGVAFVEAKAEGVEHGVSHSTLSLSPGGSSRSGGSGNGSESDETLTSTSTNKIEARIVLDATGHSRKLVQWDQPFEPGYQGAYGIAATVDRHPFALDSMLFMDWRDDHTQGFPEMRARNQRVPTFLYAMPFSPTEVFLEETSLVARPAVGFDELRERLERRLEHLKIAVKEIHEVERCLIPMGGVLPRLPQRTVGIGGSAGMVHPSTGYMVARALGAAPGLGDAIVDALADGFRVAPRKKGSLFGSAGSSGPSSSPSSPSRTADQGPASSPSAAATTTTSEEASTSSPPPPSTSAARPTPLGAADAASTAAWASLWPLARLRQRAFFCFGMDVLLSLDLAETRVRERVFFSFAFFFLGFFFVRRRKKQKTLFQQNSLFLCLSFLFPNKTKKTQKTPGVLLGVLLALGEELDGLPQLQARLF